MFLTIKKMLDRFGLSINEFRYKSRCRIFVRKAISWAYVKKPIFSPVFFNEAKHVYKVIIEKKYDVDKKKIVW